MEWALIPAVLVVVAVVAVVLSKRAQSTTSQPIARKELTPEEVLRQVAFWRAVIKVPDKPWVLFAINTCVVLMEPEADPAAQACASLREVFGTEQNSSGPSILNYNVIPVDNQGWVVCFPKDIFTFLSADQIGAGMESLIVILGRTQVGDDAKHMRVLHVENSPQGQAVG